MVTCRQRRRSVLRRISPQSDIRRRGPIGHFQSSDFFSSYFSPPAVKLALVRSRLPSSVCRLLSVCHEHGIRRSPALWRTVGHTRPSSLYHLLSDGRVLRPCLQNKGKTVKPAGRRFLRRLSFCRTLSVRRQNNSVGRPYSHGFF